MLLRPMTLLLHVGPPPLGPFWTAWPAEPVLQIALATAAALYWLGWQRLRRRGGARVLAGWRSWAFAGGLFALALALLSPIAAYDEALFFVHMIQHLLLLLVAPPLLLLSAPLVPWLWALPFAARRRVGRWLAPGRPLARIGSILTTPAVAAAAYVATVAVWHVPACFDLAQGRTLTHDLEHAMFFGTALLYWWPVIHPVGGRRTLSYAAAIPYLLPPMLEGILIGALITFAGRPLYQTYVGLPPTWGFSTLADQQLGGLIMWVPGGLLFLIPLLGLLAALLRQEERNAQRAEAVATARVGARAERLPRSDSDMQPSAR
ncbi:MAG TPA: cytochrome c oxidase assembly protein [Thermomicrobiales bacterium]|jgi:cytochrome c oxidase assembly factor CtaG|nr:cytochrome c oxidase assembly protein [Thermomicrobiales bacterium]